jgi:DNA-binding NarL/FixJ family response regulator
MGEPLVEFVEAAYDTEVPTEEWLKRLGWRLRSLVREGMGVIGYRYDASDASRVRLSSVVMLEPNRAVAAAVDAAHAIGPAWGAKRVYWGGVRAGLMSESIGKTWSTFPIFRNLVAPFGVQDFFSLRASNPGQRGVMLGASLKEGRHLSSGETEMWERLGAHVASGMRLRDQLPLRDPGRDAAAVLSASGTVEHAVGDAKEEGAREILASAARRMDRARGRLRREDPREAVAIWSALVEGRWSLVDWIDRDGRRYLVARENPPPAAALSRLTHRERQVMALVAQGDSNKLVAYELGISEESVAVHVHRASRKLGASSRVDLIALYRGWVSRQKECG